MKVKDITGQIYGKLTVIEPAYKGKDGAQKWRCKCECGNETVVDGRNLRSGQTKSCGCLKSVSHTVVHGMTNSREWRSWMRMRARCLNSNSKDYERYGGRGIKICRQWENDFARFYDDMGKCPNGFTLDRIDVNGDYTPDNCRWADTITQNNNKRNNVYLELYGKRKTITQWAKHIGIAGSTLKGRLDRGWSLKKALTTPATR